MLPTEWLPLLLLLLFQGLSGTGQIQLTLLDATGTPVPHIRVHFVNEAQVPLASCTTDAAGRCTLNIDAAPTDAAGLIRGSLQVEGHGSRPVIWPGGQMDLTLQLDEAGALTVGHDVYATRLPAVRTLSPTPANPVATEVATEGLPTPPSAMPLTNTTVDEALVLRGCLLGLGLLVGTVGMACLYGWVTTRGGFG